MIHYAIEGFNKSEKHQNASTIPQKTTKILKIHLSNEIPILIEVSSSVSQNYSSLK